MNININPLNHQLTLKHANTKKENFKPHTFQELLKNHTKSTIKISKHANQRLIERNISIPDYQWKEIQGKMQEARKKGIKDSLILTSNAALIVNIDHNMVVTAMNRKEASSHIFTNINGTIIMD
ncbi:MULTISPECIES: TIGR02530 family flagellar biosynthesis protein [Bacillaceae]|uniref:TIGR02530 family flagellar biosynthesis protein n=1 Tax=Bacillaceae TaxID=186817 RepID=UPI000C78A27D|nr:MULTISPECIES: TIGR02530 family flagellar biosynthesis protein [Bacillaceae]PLR69756.1 flagellar protein [Bacillus sp. UMB0893]